MSTDDRGGRGPPGKGGGGGRGGPPDCNILKATLYFAGTAARSSSKDEHIKIRRTALASLPNNRLHSALTLKMVRALPPDGLTCKGSVYWSSVLSYFTRVHAATRAIACTAQPSRRHAITCSTDLDRPPELLYIFRDPDPQMQVCIGGRVNVGGSTHCCYTIGIRSSPLGGPHCFRWGHGTQHFWKAMTPAVVGLRSHAMYSPHKISTFCCAPLRRSFLTTVPLGILHTGCR